MTREDKYIIRITFKARALSADGQAFEDLFTQIMQQANPEFRPVKPQGPKGDQKNDGFDKSAGKYYQVYAPEDIVPNVSVAAKKLTESFDGLLEYWDKQVSPIKECCFVVNDKYKGTYPDIEAALAHLGKKHKKVKCTLFLLKDLEDVLMSLPEDKMVAAIDTIPDVSKIGDVDFSVMNDVIGHLMRSKIDWQKEAVPPSPDFNKKITFNKLNKKVALLLKGASLQTHVIEDYFKCNSEYSKAELRKIFSDLYKEGVDSIPDSKEKNDVIFFTILEKSSPRKIVAVQDVVLVLMAYYFEYCDIFEIPG